MRPPGVKAGSTAVANTPVDAQPASTPDLLTATSRSQVSVEIVGGTGSTLIELLIRFRYFPDSSNARSSAGIRVRCGETAPLRSAQQALPELDDHSRGSPSDSKAGSPIHPTRPSRPCSRRIARLRRQAIAPVSLPEHRVPRPEVNIRRRSQALAPTSSAATRGGRHPRSARVYEVRPAAPSKLTIAHAPFGELPLHLNRVYLVSRPRNRRGPPQGAPSPR